MNWIVIWRKIDIFDFSKFNPQECQKGFWILFRYLNSFSTKNSQNRQFIRTKNLQNLKKIVIVIFIIRQLCEFFENFLTRNLRQ